MNKLKIMLLLLFVLTINNTINAQHPYTLKQCTDSALKNNLNIQSAGFDLKKAEEAKREALAGFLPQVTATGNYQYYTKVPGQLISSSLLSVSGQNLPKYLTGSLSLPQTTQANAKLEQTLYNGQLLIALKAAKVNTKIYAIQLTNSKEDVAYNVGATYYNIQSLTEKVKLLEDNLKNSALLINATKLKLDNGIATKTDYNRLLISRESLNASLVSTQGQLKQQMVELNFLIGKPLIDSFTVEQYVGKNSIPVLPGDQNTDVSMRSDIQLLNAQKAYSAVERMNIKAGYQPTLTLIGGYGVAGYNNEFKPFNEINNMWFKSNYVALNLSIPIYDGGKKRSQVHQKDIELEQFDAKIKLNTLQADKDVITAVINYNSNAVNLRSQYANVQLANKIYLDRQLQFENGIVTMNDVLDAKNDLIDAQNTFITSLVNTRTSELDLKKARGKLLDTTDNQ